LAVCEQCGFVANTTFDPSKLSYGNNYDNDQTLSPAFGDYIRNLAHDLVTRRKIQNSKIVEVGCGNGRFLRELVADASLGNVGYGFDPSYVGPASDLDGRLKLEPRFYDGSCSQVRADVVVCRHVIEHVAQPLELLAAIRRALVASPQARVFFETPCVQWIFRNQVICDFFYEHCSLFSSVSLATAFEAEGFRVLNIEHVFGEQYLFLEATLGGVRVVNHTRPSTTAKLAFEYAAAEPDLLRKWRERLERLARSGRVAVWGAGAKGVTFVNLLDPKALLVDCLVDLNPAKQGAFVPGSAHPIVSYRELPNRGVATAILMNPNYRIECQKLLHGSGISVELVE
jgi:SAM-dependent methyltransferase